MTTILNAIYDFLSQLVCWIMTALVLTLNLILAALGAVMAALAALLPEMSEAGTPSVPTEITAAAGWVNWFFPVDTAFLFIQSVITIELAMFTWRATRFLLGLFLPLSKF